MSVIQPVSVVSSVPPQTVWEEPFTAPWDYPDGTYLEDATTLFTRQYPNTDQTQLRYVASVERAQLDSASLSAAFSWDEPGETSGAFNYKFDLAGAPPATVRQIYMFLCWTPDEVQADLGDGYALFWSNAGTLRFYEMAGGVLTQLGSAAKTSTTDSWTLEVEYNGTDTFDCYLYRVIDGKPGSPTLSVTDSTSTSGKVGFRNRGPNGAWIDNLYIDKGWS